MEPVKETGQATRKLLRLFAVSFIVVCVVYHSETLGLLEIILYQGMKTHKFIDELFKSLYYYQHCQGGTLPFAVGHGPVDTIEARMELRRAHLARVCQLYNGVRETR